MCFLNSLRTAVHGLNSCSLTPDTGVSACAVTLRTDTGPKLRPVADLLEFNMGGAVETPVETAYQ